jgi:hypothetical protein
MKNAAAIFLVILLMSVQTPLGQFLKVPLLIEHYIKHQKQDGISFTSFLKDHYAPDHNDGEMPEDEQLPFKELAFQNIGFAIFAPLIQTEVLLPLKAEKRIVFSDGTHPQKHLMSIFHPPRIQPFQHLS